MTKAQKQRFLELKSLGVDMNESQQEEFDKLAEVAVKAGLDLETLQEVDQSSLTEAELQQVIKGCVQDELFGMSEQIQDRLESSATKEDLERAIKKYASEQVDEDELVAKITKALPQGENLKAEDLAEAFKSAVGSLPLQSNHEYPVEKEEKMTIEVPFGNSKGNLTVASKQLHNILCNKPQNEGISDSQIAKAKANASAYRSKALDTGTASTRTNSDGGALVNTDISTVLEERVYLESALANAMRAQEIQMPTNVFEIPLLTARAPFAKVAEGAGVSDAPPSLATRNLTSVKFAGRADYSYELDDDSVIAVLPMLQDQLAKGAADALEESILFSKFVITNGATPAVLSTIDTFDTGVMYANNNITNSDTGAGKFSAGAGVDVADARGLMGVAGIRSEDLLLVLTPKAYGEFLGSSDLLTFDKLGGNATLLQGAIGQVLGINVVVSDNFKASTQYDNGGGQIKTANTAGTETIHGVLINTTQFKMGVRGEFVVETDRNITSQTNQVVASFRRAMNVLDVNNPPSVIIHGA